MTEYKCNSCDHIFVRKQHLDNHVNNNACRKKKFNCSYCDDTFTTSNSMYRHMKYNCKTKKKEDIKKNGILERLIILENENKHLKEKVRNLECNKNTSSSKNINNTINVEGDLNINNGIINNISLVGYGRDDLAKIDKADILRAIKDGYGSVVSLSKTVHFNPKYPEYQNIYISNMKDIYAMMFDGNKWTLTTKADLVEKIYQDKKDYIEENLEEFVASLLPSRKRALERWLDTDEEDDKIRKIKNDIKILLYNEKQLGIDSRELYESKIKSIKSGTESNIVKHNRSQKVKPLSIKTKTNDNDNSDNHLVKNEKIVKTSKTYSKGT
jgi:hypothetical protein